MADNTSQLTLKNTAGKDAGKVDLDAAVFGLEPNVPVMHQVVDRSTRSPTCRHAEHEDPL